MFYDDVLSFDPPHAHLFKPGFHMMATIVAITVISEKISSAIAVIICKPLPTIVAFAAITATMISEIEKVLWLLLRSLEIMFPYDCYNR